MVKWLYLQHKLGRRFQKWSSVPTGKTRVLARLTLCPRHPFLWAPAGDGRGDCCQIPEVQKLPVRLWFDFVVNACTHTHAPVQVGASQYLWHLVLVRLSQWAAREGLCLSSLSTWPFTYSAPPWSHTAQKVTVLGISYAHLSSRWVDMCQAPASGRALC